MTDDDDRAASQGNHVVLAVVAVTKLQAIRDDQGKKA